jgi:hypothetical protein
MMPICITAMAGSIGLVGYRIHRQCIRGGYCGQAGRSRLRRGECRRRHRSNAKNRQHPPRPLQQPVVTIGTG